MPRGDVDGKSLVGCSSTVRPRHHMKRCISISSASGPYVTVTGNCFSMPSMYRPNDRNVTLEGLFLTNLKMDPSESRNLLESYPQQAGELLELRLQYVASLSGPRK